MSNPSNSSNTSNVGQPSSLTNGTAHSLNQPVQNKDIDIDTLQHWQYSFYPNVAGAHSGNNERLRPRWAFLWCRLSLVSFHSPCTRCQMLKVKCEFRSDTDPCKRCLNGGHECVIWKRKKRRTPPFVFRFVFWWSLSHICVPENANICFSG